MASLSSHAPKHIPIHTGEHTVSPHLTSLKKTELENTAHLEPERLALPAPHKAEPINVATNLALPTPSVREEIGRRVAVARAAATTHFPRAPHVTRHAHHLLHVPRASLAFVLVALLIVAPLKAVTTYEQLRAAQSDVSGLKITAGALRASNNFSDVNTTVSTALEKFQTAQNSLNHLDGVEEFVLRHTPFFGSQFGAGTRLVTAGEHVTLAAQSYVQLFEMLRAKQNAPLIERLQLFFDGNRAVRSDIQAAADLVRPIDPSSLGQDQQKFVASARTAILALNDDTDYLASAGPVILSALGSNTPRRYLIVFQNPTELRPTGGFIGSFAIVDIANGEVKQLHIPPGGSYDLNGSLRAQVRAPLPLHIINPQWQFQDGNWFPDFPTSAKKLMWFLEKSQGPSVDGVIAVNATILPELLKIVGPISIAGTPDALTADNALTAIRASIENEKITDPNAPKKIITSAAPALIETIKQGRAEHFLPLITTLIQGLEHRDIQLYARDASLEQQIEQFGWDGALRDNPHGDFLAVIGTNIGGQKTDAVITQAIDHQATIAADGSITVTVHVQRTQHPSAAALQGGRNVNYVRFYVPLGATLVSADGFTSPPESMFQPSADWEHQDTDLAKTEKEIGIDPHSGTRITEEFGHTVFGNWMITDPGSTADALITYTLPFKAATHPPSTLEKLISFMHGTPSPMSYSVFLQRQSGMPPTTLTSRVLLPDAWRLGWITDARARVAPNGALIDTPFTDDIYYGITSYATTSHDNQKS